MNTTEITGYASAAVGVLALLFSLGGCGATVTRDGTPCDLAATPALAPLRCGTGACSITIPACGPDGLLQECVPRAPTQVEVPDGIDNNCDGSVDEGEACAAGGEPKACYAGHPETRRRGLCSDGAQACEHGYWGVCLGSVGPAVEACDGYDNDCDGVVDNGCPCVAGEEMDCFEGSKESRGVGPCRAGRQACVVDAAGKAAWGPCRGQTLPGVEVCDNVDNDCDGRTDETCPCSPGKVQDCFGGPSSTRGVGTCLVGTQVCDDRGQWSACEGDVLPRVESCNGLDDDCDGQTDENADESLDPKSPCDVAGAAGVCIAGVKRCVGGAVVCVSNHLPSAEACNGLDDDCNGKVDDGAIYSVGDPCSVAGAAGVCSEGRIACSLGALTCRAVAAPTPEGCDGKDNDCNGRIDDALPDSGACRLPGSFGECAIGRYRCEAGVLECGVAAAPVSELCDGKDNDCDGVTDNGNPGGGGACELWSQYGICRAGVRACSSGVLTCAQAVSPRAEVCNDLDDDCNGRTDDHVPGYGNNCLVDGLAGECALGTTQCVSGVARCMQSVWGSVEVCDGLDNNCNGAVDEYNPGGGAVCSVAGAVGVCVAGTTSCANGMLSCVGNVRPGTLAETCNGKDDDCNGKIDDVVGGCP